MISTVIAGRDDPVLAGLVGNTIECVSVRVSVREDMTFRDLVEAVGEEYRLACSYNVPRVVMMESLGESAAELAAPLFNFVIASAPTPAAPIPADTNGVRVQFLDFKGPEHTVGTEWKSHDLHVYDSGTAMRGFVNYRPAVFRRQTIEGFLDTMLGWLEALAEGPHRQIGDWRDNMQRG